MWELLKKDANGHKFPGVMQWAQRKIDREKARQRRMGRNVVEMDANYDEGMREGGTAETKHYRNRAGD